MIVAAIRRAAEHWVEADEASASVDASPLNPVFGGLPERDESGMKGGVWHFAQLLWFSAPSVP
jgi:hypothetical protein